MIDQGRRLKRWEKVAIGAILVIVVLIIIGYATRGSDDIGSTTISEQSPTAPEEGLTGDELAADICDAMGELSISEMANQYMDAIEHPFLWASTTEELREAQDASRKAGEQFRDWAKFCRHPWANTVDRDRFVGHED